MTSSFSAPPAALSNPLLTHPATTYAIQSRAAATVRAYRAGWSAWTAWTAVRALEPLHAHPDAIADYVAERAASGLSLSTIQRDLAAIAHARRLADLPPPASLRLSMVVEGIARSRAGVSPARASAATPAALRAMLPHCSVRDRALLLVGFGAALRRSELAALDLADVTLESRGVLVRIRRSKSDQRGEGRVLAIARGVPGFCAADALAAWLAERGPLPGALFGVGDRTVCRVVAAAAAAAGLAGSWSGHSLRAGLITAAKQAGADLAGIALHARHARPDTTLGYIRDETAWEGNVTARVFGAP